MSAERFIRLFDGKQVPSKDQTNYLKKQQEEPLPQPAPRRGPVTTPNGPIQRMSMDEIVHQTRGKP
jgi:hypothetical protein